MPTLQIQGTELSYTDADIITFVEGIIGLPNLRRMVLVRQSDIEPFMWLASVEDESLAFLVADPRSLFSNYNPVLPADVRARLNLTDDEAPTVLAIVLIAPDWQQSSINLRAPLFISSRTMQGAQIVLTDSSYKVNEPLPVDRAA